MLSQWFAAILAANPDVDGGHSCPRHYENTLAWMLAGDPSTHSIPPSPRSEA
ncbi:hypothetical protein ACH47B_01880 [Rhodococcus sp. NPDC019627]|uniref:hypothetical protein n=1 Tax=unclassified Rhodococcus (in: high G+C Gram-positive bacteria) TaxID=192944 RepID=UPI0033C3982F